MSRRVRRRIGVALAALCVTLMPAGTVLVVSRDVPDPDLIVSLASHEWERLPLVARLTNEYPEAFVLLTRPRVVNEFNCHACDERAEWLTGRGVDAERIRVVRLAADGTYAEATAALAFAQAIGSRSIVVATSPYHTRRALAVFRTVFAGSRIPVGIVPASEYSEATPWFWWFADYDRRYVPYEWAAMVYYTWRHRIPPSSFLLSPFSFLLSPDS